MKNFIRAIASAAVGLGIAGVASADVYSNVFFWSRGIGGDADGDGLFGGKELRDSVHPGFSTTCVLGGVAPTYTNEWAHLPYRGTTNFVRSVYLSHPVTITNEETGAGYGRSSAIRIPSSVVEPLINAEKPSYTAYLRFKPDLDQPHPTYSWILNMGNNGNATPKRGLMIGFNNVRDVGYQYGGEHYYTNRLGTVYVMYGGSGWTVDSTHMRVGLGNWNDLIVSVDGTGEKGKISVLHSRDGYSWHFFDSYTNSSVNVWRTCYMEKSDIALSDYDLRPNGNMVLGSENHTGSQTAYVDHNSGNGNHWKSFRGQIQTLAIWTNALSEAEMREAIAYPRMDLWRVGLDNDAATEFYDRRGPGEPVDVEGDVWRVPPLAAGESLAFRFQLDGWGEATMNEFLRIKSTSSSSPATLKVAVNGTVCDGTKSVVPGRSARWFVPSSLLRANATNEIAVMRTDAGAGAFTIDSVRFGGSVQFGHLNGGADEFTMEGNYQNAVYDLIGANFFDASRALFGGTPNEEGKTRGVFSNQVVRFSVPDDLMGRMDSYTFAYRVQSQPSQTLDVTLNGRTLVEKETADDAARTVDVPAAWLLPTNEVRFINSGVFKDGCYFGIDYFQFSVQKPAAGLFLILR